MFGNNELKVWKNSGSFDLEFRMLRFIVFLYSIDLNKGQSQYYSFKGRVHFMGPGKKTEVSLILTELKISLSSPYFIISCSSKSK